MPRRSPLGTEAGNSVEAVFCGQSIHRLTGVLIYSKSRGEIGTPQAAALQNALVVGL